MDFIPASGDILKGITMIITIDGPVASGKSTTAQALAHALSIAYFSSGYLYRALSFLLHEQCGLSLDAIAQLTPEDIIACMREHRLEFTLTANGFSIMCDGKEITPHLKTVSLDQLTPLVSKYAAIRQVVLQIQRDLARNTSFIIDGRDCGTVVFPQAEYKFFIIADQLVRAQRWLHDQQKKDSTLTLAQAIAFVAQRDNTDLTRTLSPLKKATDAYIIDSTFLSSEQVVDQCLAIIKR